MIELTEQEAVTAMEQLHAAILLRRRASVAAVQTPLKVLVDADSIVHSKRFDALLSETIEILDGTNGSGLDALISRDPSYYLPIFDTLYNLQSE